MLPSTGRKPTSQLTVSHETEHSLKNSSKAENTTNKAKNAVRI